MPHTPGIFSDSEFMVGCTVFTRDGEVLGMVKEVGTGVFKVDAALQPDYWLSTGHIASSATDRLVLSFDEDQLGDYQLDNPDDIPTTERMQTPTTAGRRMRSR